MVMGQHVTASSILEYEGARWSEVDSPSEPLPQPQFAEPTPSQRVVSALGGAFLTSLVVTPFDVVKNRLQAGSTVVGSGGTPVRVPYEPITECCREVFVGIHDPVQCSHQPAIPQSRLRVGNFPRILMTGQAVAAGCALEAGAAGSTEAVINGTWDGMIKIARYEGLSSLWSGLSPTLVMQVPATVVYYVGYESLRDTLLLRFHNYPNIEFYAPLFAGIMARTVAAFAISPIELIRTRMQSVAGNEKQFNNVLQGVRNMMRAQGASSLWRGMAATLWRDVPFSGIYWSGYETLRDRLKRRYPAWNETAVGFYSISFISGAAAGMVAATVTTPFDVAKTRKQITDSHGAHMKMMNLMRTIVQDEGWRGLTTGLTARIAKVAPACAIMISSYEAGKFFFRQRNAEIGHP
ncbi:mitochondrial carrier [Gonapodya prolifera JEL478]|uniref:Mitochondrial carrier n=1 Tax=Gonapodya prolifera (strain JEL478) TaxID=1344416 RepID=A0A139AME4_GONPJ|nr:mitochondrial carrier [Gonapodya prolifera JEL478]|eukprot:KXS17941.1 mitochondrial carrier [Gonapodya prolifera JEL478]